MLPTALVGRTYGGSYFCREWELRVTGRCLKEDLAAATDVPFEELRKHEIIKALIRERTQRTDDTRQVHPLTCGQPVWVLARGHDHRGATWFDEQERVVWLLAYGRHRSGQAEDFFPYCKDLDEADRLLPSASDYEALLRERDKRFAWSITIEAPVALKKARDSGVEELVMLGGEYGACVAVEAEPEIEATTLAFRTDTVPFSHVPLILAAFHAEVTDWEQVFEMPSRPLRPNEIAFRHHHDPPEE